MAGDWIPMRAEDVAGLFWGFRWNRCWGRWTCAGPRLTG